MLNIITSNIIGIKDIKQYNDNFIICHTREKPLMPYMNSQMGYQFDIYHQGGMDLSEYDDYKDTPDLRYHFHPIGTVMQALEEIGESIITTAQDQMNSDNPVEVAVVTVCDINWNYQAERKLNTLFNQAQVELTCLNLYKYMKIAKPEKLVQFVKEHLRTDYIYPDDPVAFSYALMCVFGGVIV